MTHTRITAPLVLLFALGLLVQGCALQQHEERPAPARSDTQQEARLGEALFTALRQRAGGVWALDPGLAAYVSSVGATLARLSERPALNWEFVVLNESAPGAWALPGGKVAVTRGLLVQLDDEAELAALFMLAIEHALQPADTAAESPHAGAATRLVEIGPLRSDAPWYEITLDAERKMSAAQPLPADGERFPADGAVLRQLERTGYDPLALVRLLQILLGMGDDADPGDPDFAIHHCTTERVEAARQAARKLEPGERGSARFQERTRRLRRDTAAYEIYARGLDALVLGQNTEALAAAAQALHMQPREALFHELQAVAAWQLTRPAVAFGALNRAIALDPGFFRPHLLRGLLHLVRGNLELAAEDLLAANRLLPSVEATLGLAEVARGLGDTATARELYAAVAGGNSPAGAFARERIAQLTGELPTP